MLTSQSEAEPPIQSELFRLWDAKRRSPKSYGKEFRNASVSTVKFTFVSIAV